MHNRIALGVEYQGTHYCGWQRQSHCESVQGLVERALARIAAEPVDVHCAGRTDTGVHAVGQVVHFETSAQRPLKAWVQGVNTNLPGNIRVAWSKVVAHDFHARFSAVARQYRYVIFNRKVHSAVLADRVTWEERPLDERNMHLAAQALIGEQDFSSFRAAACQASHARRNVQSVEVSRRGDFVFIDIQANAFLHHMVRNISGTLMKIGRGEKPIEWVDELLQLEDRTQAAATAPASGLYFVNALYPDEYDIPRVKVDEVLWQ
ncbi:MAG: tRNA pseudouridine(38-40) synthase TruA [Thiomicrorhabdus chilensis]|uniref:tRNA pseudouridine(38-40) synthase TruA n=1 Tax=Thiomicrorhabdus chilensis TaxID=63656 RepID=UPI00299E2C86|nr:tRNA pseudouridine(38-40) synthase TruA [Thiomicrorhabdus chilensis]MDX1346843.1 tRNA pseudouridine(38-40) synthase TruA [Thiomicrorhabdus chilensis]